MENFNARNEDIYHRIGKIWEIAKRHNDESFKKNGNHTVVRKRIVKSTERVALR